MSEQGGQAVREIEVAAAVIERGGRYLITQRPEGTHLAGLWEFPGGKRGEGEAWEDCLSRELREELGVEAKVGSLLHETTHAYDDRRVRLRFYRCRLGEAEPVPLDVAQLAWVRPAELAGYAFPPADREILSLLGSGDHPVTAGG